MAYSDSFSVQWDRFVSDFVSSLKGWPAEMISTERLNDWYKTNSFRWSSIADNEGILLEHENNSVLKNELLKELAKFSFSEVKLLSKPSIFPYLGVGIPAAVGLGAALKHFLHQGLVVAVLETLAGIVCTIVLYVKKLNSFNKKQVKTLEKEYSAQLIAYKDHLLRVCKQYESNSKNGK